MDQFVSDFNIDTLSNSLANGDNSFFKNLEAFAYRGFSVSDIGIDRKLLHLWKKSDLLPYLQQKGWGNYSFIEVCWLKYLVELRNVGIGFDKIRKIKSYFFDDEFTNTLFSTVAINVSNIAPSLAKEIQQRIDIKNGHAILSDSNLDVLKELQFSAFSFLIYNIILERKQQCIYIDAKDNIGIIDIDVLRRKSVIDSNNFFNAISNTSMAIVNMTNVIANVSKATDIFDKHLPLARILSSDTVEYMRRLLADNKIKEITIRKPDNGDIILSVKRNMDITMLRQQIREISNKGVYRDIQIKTRDGNVQYLEITDLIKL